MFNRGIYCVLASEKIREVIDIEPSMSSGTSITGQQQVCFTVNFSALLFCDALSVVAVHMEMHGTQLNRFRSMANVLYIKYDHIKNPLRRLLRVGFIKVIVDSSL